MNPLILIKRMLPGFLPLLAYVVASEFMDEMTSLYVGLGLGLVEFVFILVRERRPDWFTLVDMALLAAMGAISLALDNAIFFKLKPALAELILFGILALSAFGPVNLMFEMASRKAGGIKLDEKNKYRFRSMMRIFALIVAAHIALIIFSAYAMSKEAWAFISGVLLYILVAAFAGEEILRARLSARRNAQKSMGNPGECEMLPIVDEEGRQIGSAPRPACHAGKSILHPVVHVMIHDRAGRIYLQRRALDKLVQPGKWDCAVGGHVSLGETIELACAREMAEEIGVRGPRPEPFARFVWKTELEAELVYLHLLKYEGPFEIDPKEVAEARFWERREIAEAIGKGILTPLIEREYEMVKMRLRR